MRGVRVGKSIRFDLEATDDPSAELVDVVDWTDVHIRDARALLTKVQA